MFKIGINSEFGIFEFESIPNALSRVINACLAINTSSLVIESPEYPLERYQFALEPILWVDILSLP